MDNEYESLEWTGFDEFEVMMAVDELNGERHVIIADVSCDGAWIALPENKAWPLPSWR